MRANRFQPASACLLAASVAIWLVVAPLLVICTCHVGHAAITTTSHAEAACGHEPCSGSTPIEEESHEELPGPHRDTELVIDIASPRTADVIALPSFDVVIALLPDFSFASSTGDERCRSFVMHDTGPPQTIVHALAATILLI